MKNKILPSDSTLKMNREGDPLDSGYHSDEGLGANYKCSLCGDSCTKRYTIKCVTLADFNDEYESEERPRLVAKYVICNGCVRSDADRWVKGEDVRVE